MSAIAVSVFVHLVLAAGLCGYFAMTPAPVVLAQLDLSSVELSLAEEDVAVATPMASFPSGVERLRPKAETGEPPLAESGDVPMPTLAEPQPPEAKRVIPELPELASKQARVEAPPKSKTMIRPDYPRGARIRNEEGDVFLEIRVTAEGSVDDVRVVDSSGFAELDEEAVRATKAARFIPAKSGEESVASVARLKFTFRLK